MQGDFSFPVPLSSSNVRTSKTSCTANSDPFRSKVHGGLKRPFHGASETDPALQLDSYVFSHQLGIKFGISHFHNINLHLGRTTDLRDIARHALDL